MSILTVDMPALPYSHGQKATDTATTVTRICHQSGYIVKGASKPSQHTTMMQQQVGRIRI